MQERSPYYSTGKSFIWVVFCRAPVLLVITTCFYGCAYKFTNKYVQRPSGIRSIAVEAIFDTSREVIPHEYLWKHLQQAVVADGNLILTDRESADAIMRVHLKDTVLQNVGDTLGVANERDPDVFEGGLPPKPSEFRKLTQAGRYKGTARLTSGLEVEVWHLETKQILFKRSYALSTSFKTFRAGAGTNVTKENEFLRFEEAIENRFSQEAEVLSRRIVRDLLAP